MIDTQTFERENGIPLFTLTEIESAFKAIVDAKIKNKRQKISLIGYEPFYDPKKFSMLPIGLDGVTTAHVYKSEEAKEEFLFEIYRLVNLCEKNRPKVPKLNFKKFKVLDIETKPGKSRKIAIPCLRDQVVVRCILNRLNAIGIVDEANKPNQNIPNLTKAIKNLMDENPSCTIIRSDIKNFYPSVDTNLLVTLLQDSHGEVIGERLMALIKKALIDNKSKNDYTGLPVGMGTSVLFANYYISQLGLTNFYEGVKVIRYEDDVLMFLNEGIDPENVKVKLDEKLATFRLERNIEKTEIKPCMSPFVFLGVSYENGQVSISEERNKKWISDVNKDVQDEIKNFRFLELVDPKVNIPTKKEIIKTIWKAHMFGNRSYFHQHYLKIKAINENGK
jgi:hypothetical protein